MDDFFLDLSFVERLLWIGLINSLADDQGRLQNSPRIIKAEIFPCDEIPVSQIEEALHKFSDRKKILFYSVNNKPLIQIINWWKYQASASWMAKSNYSPPDGWQDYYRTHVQGGGIETSPNWESKQAGFLPSNYIAPHYPLHRRDGDLKGEGKDENEGKVENDCESEKETKAEDVRKGKENLPSSTSSFPSSSLLSPLEIYQSVTAQASYPKDQSELVNKFESLLSSYSTQQEAINCLTKVFSKWVSSRRKGNDGYYSPFNLGWIDWAFADINNKDGSRDKAGNSYIEGKYADCIQH
ncbi:MAG: hypothetical protein ABSA01_13500 [Anaerolineales bacterium]|jgi:hypothetical protein